MDRDDLDIRLEVERCKLYSEQNKKDIDELGNTLRLKNESQDKEISKLTATSIRVYAYIAAIASLLMAFAWLADHKGMFL